MGGSIMIYLFVKHSVLLFIIITFVVGHAFFFKNDTVLINYIARE